jgi:hypothetical protein
LNICVDLPNSAQIIGNWLYTWQTLISGGLALAAAWWAGRLINKQIRQSEKLAAELLNRQHNAARAALPLALSDILAYCQNMAKDIVATVQSIATDNTGTDSTQSAEPLPFGQYHIPENAIGLVYRFIETLDDESEVKHVVELTSRIQMLQGRFHNILPANQADPASLNDLLIFVATVYFLTESLFNYARFVDEDSFAKVETICTDAAWNGILEAASRLIFSVRGPAGQTKAIAEMIDELKKSSKSPWLERFEA